MVTVTAIRESRFNEQLSNTCVSVTPDLYHKTHTEVKVKNGVSMHKHMHLLHTQLRTGVSHYLVPVLYHLSYCVATSLHIIVSQPHLGVCFWSGCRFLSTSLALLMENPAAPPEIAGAIPRPWQPDHILEDFRNFGLRNVGTLSMKKCPVVSVCVIV